MGIACLTLIIVSFYFSYIKKEKAENKIIEQLPSASAQQVLEDYFWGINNNSRNIVKACLYNKNIDFDYNYSDIEEWIVLDIQEVAPDTNYHLFKEGRVLYAKNFKVKFKLKKKFFVTDPSMTSGTYLWTYTLVKENDNSPWQIADWGGI
jgi:hypothetical protein